MTQPNSPNLQAVQQLGSNPPPELVSLAESLLVATAMHQLKAEAVHAYQTKVLAEMQPHLAKKWIDMGVPDQIILDPKIAYLLDDETAARYYSRCEEERLAANMSVEREGNCPALEAETLFRAARDAFVDALTPYTTITLDHARMTLGVPDKLADWGLRILAKHVDPHRRFSIPQAA